MGSVGNVTMIVDINAFRSHVRAVLIFPRLHLKNDMLSAASTVSIGGANPTFWSNQRFVVDYLKHFIAYEMSGKEDTFRLILDKFDPQLSIPAIIVTKQNDISLITLPPHTSHKLRPLDCTIFDPYGTYGNTYLNDWILSNPNKPTTIYSVALIIGKSVGKAFVKHNVEKRFHMTGIYTLN